MTVSQGTAEYTLGTKPITECGRSYSADELDKALAGPVTDILYDNPGKANIKALLIGVTETDFEKDAIERILSNTKPPEDWRVGEALAECYLVDQRNCFFPWPDSRDERKSGSSLPGADLVGFQSENNDDIFAFGEVKTSTENKYPTGAMYSKTGLKQQIENLKSDIRIKDNIVKYLGHRAVNALWRSRYKSAAKNYIQSKTNIRIFGFLIRDVKPNQNDLGASVTQLANNTHADMVIELIALYLPPNSIGQLSNKVVKIRNGGAA